MELDKDENKVFQPDIDLHVQEILLAASQHDISSLGHLLENLSFPDCNAVDVQDSETGFCPLHAAVAACDESGDEEDIQPEGLETKEDSVAENGLQSGKGEDQSSSAAEAKELPDTVVNAEETVQFLLENGAIWNQLDQRNETPGCLAHRLGLERVYQMMVDAGVRAELLLGRLSEYEALDGDPEEDEQEAEGQDSPSKPSNGAVVDGSSAYLSSRLTFDDDKILDDQSNGVMMAWETGIMAKSADSLLTTPGLRILNIGFGMGIIDGLIQSHENRPIAHHIIEAHPKVLSEMKTKGWHEKNGVTVHDGKWQDVLPKLLAQEKTFDAIYFDTFAEDYAQFRTFVSEYVMGLLEPSGSFSFFNGMGADRQISYDVYQKVVEMDLYEFGFDVRWEPVEIPQLDQEWEGVKRRYWNVDQYRLPVCRFMD